MRTTRRHALLSLLAAGIAFPSLAHAHDRAPWRSVAVREPITVSLEGDDGMTLPTVRHRGTTFVAGTPGERYAIRVRNNTARRLEVVVTVDGRDVLTGRLGDFTRQRGYVIDPFGSVVIDGFRRSLDRVAAFRFSDVHDSFTALHGTPQHAGVIGVAAFEERVDPPRGGTVARRSTAPATDPRARPDTPAPSKKSEPGEARSHRDTTENARQALGTEFAETRLSRVREVTFVRRNARRPDVRVTLRYDTAEALAAKGVPVDLTFAVQPVGADPWPGTREFTAPPPRRRVH